MRTLACLFPYLPLLTQYGWKQEPEGPLSIVKIPQTRRYCAIVKGASAPTGDNHRQARRILDRKKRGGRIRHAYRAFGLELLPVRSPATTRSDR